MTSWRRLRDWTEAGVWPGLHKVLLAELRAAGLLDMDVAAVNGSHIRALKGGRSHRTFAGRPCASGQQAPSDHRPARPPPVTVFIGSAMGPPAFGSGMTSPSCC